MGELLTNLLRMTTTYSMWSLFRNCRKAVEWRYLRHLVPRDRDSNLHFGALIHECLERWHARRDLAEVFGSIDRQCPERTHDEHQLRDWHNATAMMRGYAARYPEDSFSGSPAQLFSIQQEPYMKKLIAILKLFPVILGAIQAVEEVIPLPGQGRKKLDLILDVVKTVYDGSSDLAREFTFDKLVAIVVPMIAKIVGLHNELGLFANRTSRPNQA